MHLANSPYCTALRRLVILIFLLTSSFAWAASAGQVDFTHGTVTATGADGSTRVLSKGSQVHSGDVINTSTEGRVQIRFSDGSHLSLQPGTLFRIDKFTFNGRSDGNEKAFFTLVKGGLRKITGAVGKVNKENYSVTTPSATIGVRGTAYSALQNEKGLTVSVGEGMVFVGNQQGSLTLSAGQSAFVASPQTSPVMSNEKVLLPRLESPQQDSAGIQVALSDNRDAKGKLSSVVKSTPSPVENLPPILTTGTGYTVAYARSDMYGGTGNTHAKNDAYATLDTLGTLLKFESGAFRASFDGDVKENGADSLIGWGRWTGPVSGNIDGVDTTTTYAANEGFHYVVGMATPTANLNGLTGSITYSMIGHTLPTTYDGESTSLGTVSSGGKVVVSFGADPTMTMDFRIRTEPETGHTYDMSLVGPVRLAIGGSKATFTGSADGKAACRGSCTVEVNGLFAGSKAERMGFAYQINDSASDSNYRTKGAVAFRR